MSDTPRTEAAYDAADDSKLYELSQQLERELRVATDAIVNEREERQMQEAHASSLAKELAILRAAQSYQYSPPPDNRWHLLANRLATQLYAKPEDTKTPEDRIVLDMYSHLAVEPNEP